MRSVHVRTLHLKSGGKLTLELDFDASKATPECIEFAKSVLALIDKYEYGTVEVGDSEETEGEEA